MRDNLKIGAVDHHWWTLEERKTLKWIAVENQVHLILFIGTKLKWTLIIFLLFRLITSVIIWIYYNKDANANVIHSLKVIELNSFINIVPEYWTKNYTNNGFLLWINPSRIHLYRLNF